MSGADYISLSLATVLERSLDTTANNIANMSTTGFKAVRPMLDTLSVRADGRGGESINYVQDRGVYLDYRQGAFSKTDNPLDIAISGDAWFSFLAGDGEQVFGRDGRFVMSPEGVLTTPSGAALLDVGGSPVTLPADIGTNFNIASDGSITDGAGDVLGQIGLFSIDNPNALTAVGEGLFLLGKGGVSEVSRKGSVLQGYLEQSNVEGIVEVTRMMDIQRAYERAVKVIDQADEVSRTAIQRISQKV